MVDLHYKCGAVLFVASVIGCLLPFQNKFDVTPIRPLSTGIIFAVALCHLLPDAGQILDTLPVTNWLMQTTRLHGSVGNDGLYETLPVAETLMCFGIFVMLVIDQCIPCPHHQVQKPSGKDPCGGDSPPMNGEKTRLLAVADGNGHGTVYSSNGTNGDSIENGHSHLHHHKDEHGNAHSHSHHHHHTHDDDDGTNIVQQMISNAKVYATELAIATHSIIIGFTMGIDPRTDGLIGFTIAMVFHQLFEGIALAMIAKQGLLNGNSLVFMVVMFASSLPTGIWIGKCIYNYYLAQKINSDDAIDNEELDLGTIFFQGVPNAIAAGMLIHIGFELMMEDFNHKTTKFPTFKIILVFMGGFTMCFLTFWA